MLHTDKTTENEIIHQTMLNITSLYATWCQFA